MFDIATIWIPLLQFSATWDFSKWKFFVLKLNFLSALYPRFFPKTGLSWCYFFQTCFYRSPTLTSTRNETYCEHRGFSALCDLPEIFNKNSPFFEVFGGVKWVMFSIVHEKPYFFEPWVGRQREQFPVWFNTLFRCFQSALFMQQKMPDPKITFLCRPETSHWKVHFYRIPICLPTLLESNLGCFQRVPPFATIVFEALVVTRQLQNLYVSKGSLVISSFWNQLDNEKAQRVHSFAVFRTVRGFFSWKGSFFGIFGSVRLFWIFRLNRVALL